MGQLDSEHQWGRRYCGLILSSFNARGIKLSTLLGSPADRLTRLCIMLSMLLESGPSIGRQSEEKGKVLGSALVQFNLSSRLAHNRKSILCPPQKFAA